MIEKKATLVATIIAISLVGAPLAASAAPAQTSKTIVTTFHTEDGEDCVCVISAARLMKWSG